MSRAVNVQTGRIVDGDLVERLGEDFRDWKSRGLSAVGDWEINPPSERLEEIEDYISKTPARLSLQREKKIASLESDCLSMQESGVMVACGTLSATEYDQRRFATMLVGINNAIELGVMNSDSIVTIWDVNGQMIQLSVLQFKQVAAQYMAGCVDVEMRLGNAIVAVKNATTQDELEAVVL